MGNIGYFPWMGLFPILGGLLFAFSAAIPGVGIVLYAAIPWAMTVLWVWLGRRCARDGCKYAWSLLSAHWGVAQVLLVAVWQWGLLEEGARNASFSGYSQILFGVLPCVVQVILPMCRVGDTYDGRLAILWGTAATAAAFLVLFTIGYRWGKRDRKRGGLD